MSSVVKTNLDSDPDVIRGEAISKNAFNKKSNDFKVNKHLERL